MRWVFSRYTFCFSLLASSLTPFLQAAVSIEPIVISQVNDVTKKNTNWKKALVTGKSEQVVLMNISPVTNPNNEIGVEVHSFDQVILIVEGKGKAVLEKKETLVKEGDMIFIPEGTQHNVINLNKSQPLKLMSFYSATDIPSGAVYPKRSDQEEE